MWSAPQFPNKLTCSGDATRAGGPHTHGLSMLMLRIEKTKRRSEKQAEKMKTVIHVSDIRGKFLQSKVELASLKVLTLELKVLSS